MKGGDRGAIDALRSRKTAGFVQLHQKFTKPEVEVSIPEEWEVEETRIKIDWLRVAGIFDKHGQFDPNNLDCITLPWTVTNVKAIFKLLGLEYNKAMELYTMGTGGGPGALEYFNVWQEERGPTSVMSYIQQNAFIYLSLVHIWDKQYSFPFIEVNGQLPSNAAIVDGWTADADVDGASDDNNMFQTPKAGSNQNALSVENNVLKVLGKILLARASSASVSERLLSILENDQKPSSQETLVNEIAKTTKIKDDYCAKVDSLWSMKRNILHQEPTGDKAKKIEDGVVGAINSGAQEYDQNLRSNPQDSV